MLRRAATRPGGRLGWRQVARRPPIGWPCLVLGPRGVGRGGVTWAMRCRHEPRVAGRLKGNAPGPSALREPSANAQFSGPGVRLLARTGPRPFAPLEAAPRFGICADRFRRCAALAAAFCQRLRVLAMAAKWRRFMALGASVCVWPRLSVAQASRHFLARGCAFDIPCGPCGSLGCGRSLGFLAQWRRA